MLRHLPLVLVGTCSLLFLTFSALLLISDSADEDDWIPLKHLILILVTILWNIFDKKSLCSKTAIPLPIFRFGTNTSFHIKTGSFINGDQTVRNTTAESRLSSYLSVRFLRRHTQDNISAYNRSCSFLIIGARRRNKCLKVFFLKIRPRIYCRCNNCPTNNFTLYLLNLSPQIFLSSTSLFIALTIKRHSMMYVDRPKYLTNVVKAKIPETTAATLLKWKRRWRQSWKSLVSNEIAKKLWLRSNLCTATTFETPK